MTISSLQRLGKISTECETKTREIKDLRACIEEITADRYDINLFNVLSCKQYKRNFNIYRNDISDEFMRRDKETKRNLIDVQHLSDSYKDQVERLTKEVSVHR